MVFEFFYHGHAISFKEVDQKHYWSKDRLKLEINSASEEMQRDHEKKIRNTDKWEVIVRVRSKVETIEVQEEEGKLFDAKNFCPITGYTV